MKQLPDGNYCLILTPEQKAAFERLFDLVARIDNITDQFVRIPSVVSIADLCANLSPAEKARLDRDLRTRLGGGSETDAC